MGYLKRHILFVDDSPSDRALLRAMLSQAGYIVEVAEDPYEALEVIHKYAFDCIFLDIMMPNMNGIEFLKRLKNQEDTRNIPVVMLTQKDDKKTVENCLRLGAEDYMIKPPSKKETVKKLERILGGRPRFAEVVLNKEGEGDGLISFPIKILSIGESGMVMLAPFPVNREHAYKLTAPLFNKVGVKQPKFHLLESQENEGKFQLYFTFVGMSDEDVQTVRSWVIEETLKRAS